MKCSVVCQAENDCVIHLISSSTLQTSEAPDFGEKNRSTVNAQWFQRRPG